MSLLDIRKALALVALATLRSLIVTRAASASLLVFGRPMWRHLVSG